jgi:hypothetical protein
MRDSDLNGPDDYLRKVDEALAISDLARRAWASCKSGQRMTAAHE